MARFGSIGTQLTQERLKEVAHYDPETGVFTSLRRCPHVEIGDALGCERKDGYLEFRIDGKLYLAHRLAFFYMSGTWPKSCDHIDHNRKNNAIDNLREASMVDNQRNQSLRKDSSSGVTGVCWDKRRRKWMARIRINYRHIMLGRFDDWFDAVCARKSADSHYGFHENHGRAA